MKNTTSPWGMLWGIQKKHGLFQKNQWNYISEKWDSVPYTKEDIDEMEFVEVLEILGDIETLPKI